MSITDPILDMAGLPVEYSDVEPNQKIREREHIEEQTRIFLANGGKIYQAEYGETSWEDWQADHKGPSLALPWAWKDRSLQISRELYRQRAGKTAQRGVSCMRGVK